MSDHNYFDTFISVAEDCPVNEAKIPQPRGKSRTVAMMQFDMLHEHPFGHTQEDVLFEVWLARQTAAGSVAEGLAEDEVAELRRQFFAKGQPCLRASPLTKTHGWGVLFDADGRAAIFGMETEEYQVHAGDSSLTQLKAMRSKRA
ncbi:MAG: DUF6157 family protein [Acidimicrobiales bacterium]